jgi:hypothetical protein
LALETIGEFEEEGAAKLIGELINDPDPTVRCAAAAAAARAKAAATVFSLILAIDDTSAEVRQGAMRAIEVITGKIIDLDPLADGPSRQHKIDELKGWWKEERLAQLAAKSKAQWP